MGCVDDGTRSQGRGGLNAGLFVFEPNKTIYNDMLALLNNGQSWGNSDQVCFYKNFLGKS